jgi:hypothetical protein
MPLVKLFTNERPDPPCKALVGKFLRFSRRNSPFQPRFPPYTHPIIAGVPGQPAEIFLILQENPLNLIRLIPAKGSGRANLALSVMDSHRARPK